MKIHLIILLVFWSSIPLEKMNQCLRFFVDRSKLWDHYFWLGLVRHTKSVLNLLSQRNFQIIQNKQLISLKENRKTLFLNSIQKNSSWILKCSCPVGLQISFIIYSSRRNWKMCLFVWWIVTKEMTNQKLIPLGVTSLAIHTQITKIFQECRFKWSEG